jgi:glucose/arabinose dehydrogenase
MGGATVRVMTVRRRVIGGLVAAATLALAGPARAAPGLVKLGDFDSPVYVASPPGDPSRVFVVEQTGRIQLLVDGTRQSTPFLDVNGDVLTGSERGLLSMAFAPDYATSGRFWIYLTVKAAAATNGTAGQIQVREYHRGADANHADPAPVKRLLAIDHNAADNHNGGQLQLGPDGMLWLGTGDGGGGDNSAVPGSAQSTTILLGKLLRIDPNGQPYGIPSGNPFAGGGGSPEVWAYGLRNPWRFSFDRATGDLVIGDVGQGAIEEVDWAPAPGRGAGANYGWPCFEGSAAHNACTAPGPVPPTVEKNHSGDGFCAIVGGYVVRDPGLPTLAGRYLYGDNCQASLRSVALANPGGDAAAGLSVMGLTSFGEDSCGHLFAASLSGPVYRIQDGTLSACPTGGGGASPPTTSAAAPCGLRMRAYGTRKVARRRYLRLALRAAVACRVVVSGRITGVGRLHTARVSVAGGARRSVRVRLTGRTASKLRGALRRHRSVRLTLQVRGRDSAGRLQRVTRRVRLRR